jgi:hypothetical protein
MRYKQVLSLALLAYMLWACTAANGQSDPALVEPTGETEMANVTKSGPIPDQLDVRLERRDTQPLPPDALIRFQVIGRGKNPANNYRWILYDDGRLFLARHSGDTSDWKTPFDTELPQTPTQQLDARVVDEVKNQLRQANFLAQAPYQADETVEDGTFYVVTARIDGKVHEIIYDAVSTPLTDFLATIASSADSSQGGLLASLRKKIKRGG